MKNSLEDWNPRIFTTLNNKLQIPITDICRHSITFEFRWFASLLNLETPIDMGGDYCGA